MKKSMSLTIVITFILAIFSVCYSAYHNQNLKNAATPTVAQNSPATQDEAEMRGMWVSYISLDMNGTDYSEKSFTDKFLKITATAKEYGCNALFVHTRPFCDAMYKSEIFPSSHVLWGKQGSKTTYDALEIMCKICKENNLQLHAWINPYRVKSEGSSFELSQNNPYIMDSSIGVEYNGAVFLNPAKKDTRKLIVEGVAEIIENYDVDGIHFDDYFYPTSDENFDKAEYNQYLKSCKSESDALPLTEWRKSNVNMLISEVYRKIKETAPNVKFGISPQGNIENDLNMGADVKSWVECIGYVDYICPQLYYSLENPALGFKSGLKSWLEFKPHTNLKFYVGLGVYKAGSDEDEGTWLLSDNILSQELEIIRKNKSDGYILYDYEAIISEKAKTEMTNFKKKLD